MVSTKLNQLRGEIYRVWLSDRRTPPWDEGALARINEAFVDLLDEAAGQIDGWKLEMDARVELQQRILSALPETDEIAGLWWEEQRKFYADMVERMDGYLAYDESASVTFALTALEALYFLRILIEEGVIQVDSLQPVFRYLSRYGKTERHANLSFESLKKRYSLRHEGARKNVKQMLTNLIRRIDQGPTRYG